MAIHPTSSAPQFDANNTPYDAVGGDAAVRALVDDFYDRMDTSPQYTTIRELHPPNLQHARDKLYKFLCGWLGGPGLYVAEFGHPRLRARHMPFAIGEPERDQWLRCMGEALDARGVDGPLRAFLDQRFAHVADFMRNQPG